MQTMTDRFILDLAPATTVPLDAAKGYVVRVKLGMVWITEEHGTGDHILRAGEVYRVQHGGRVVIEAFSLARVGIEAPAPVALQTARQVHAWGQRAWRAAQRWVQQIAPGWSV